jgi:hypothetical protein
VKKAAFRFHTQSLMSVSPNDSFFGLAMSHSIRGEFENGIDIVPLMNARKETKLWPHCPLFIVLYQVRAIDDASYLYLF